MVLFFFLSFTFPHIFHGDHNCAQAWPAKESKNKQRRPHFFVGRGSNPIPPPSQKHIKEKTATQRGERLTEKVVTIAMLNVNLMRSQM
jgi:hypothetical protein